jgi:exodeoxyribonuclease VII large subunit
VRWSRVPARWPSSRAGSASACCRLALRLAAADQGLAALDPRQVLRRGYAWVEAADGRPVLSARALKPGDAISAVWADGRAQAEVLRVDPAADPAAEPAP